MKKTFCKIIHLSLFVFICFLLFYGCRKSNGQSSLSNRKNIFDYDWKFFQGDIKSAQEASFDDNSWRNIDLPHDWSIEGKIDKSNPTGAAGGYFPAGTGWYRKRFVVPKHWQDKCVSIYFEGVYMNSEVFINGKSLGFHPYGYTSFSYNLNPFLNYGKENIIAVRADNSQQMNCRWYSGSGIYRHVWLLVTNPVHIEQWGITITTTELNPGKASVRIKTFVKNETPALQNIVLSTQLYDKNDKNAGNNDIKIQIQPDSSKGVEQNITVNSPLLWSPENPHLYQALIRIKQENETIDSTITNFGIRSIKFSANNGFELNGKTIKINGGCVHHDNGCLGAAAYDRAEERRVELMKAAGFNTVRTSHNPPSEAFLNACDRLGLMVIDEAFDGWLEQKNKYDYSIYFKDWWQRDLESMLKRDMNHPSIIIWSIGNEVMERKKPEAVAIAKMLAQCVHNLDSTRPVTSAMTTWDKDWEIFDPLFAAHDIGGYNYQLFRAASDHKRVPSRIILQTESYPKDAFDNWDKVQSNNYIIGDVVWTALDYLGESGIGRYYYPGETPGEHWENDFFPCHGAYCGDIDLTGWRKPISHYRNLLWNNTENLYMAVQEPNPDTGIIKTTQWAVWPTWESWTWPLHEGKDIKVEVYSKYPMTRLYLNDKLIGEKQTTREQEYKAVFTLPYVQGVLKASGVKDNKEAESTILKTAGEPAGIKLTADRKEILANGQDISFITVEIIDKNGTLQPNAENILQFGIDGPGLIAGLDNGNLKDTDTYLGNTRKAWHGRALAVIKSTKASGNIKLTVTSEGLTKSIIVVKAGRE